MNYFAHLKKLNHARRYLLIGVVASLCLSFNAKLNQPAAASARAKDTETLALYAELTETAQRALTTSVIAHREPAAVKYRVKRPLAQLAVLTAANLTVPSAPARSFFLAGGASLFNSAFLISQLRGRAPPRLS
jgi:hypothetical protein